MPSVNVPVPLRSKLSVYISICVEELSKCSLVIPPQAIIVPVPASGSGTMVRLNVPESCTVSVPFTSRAVPPAGAPPPPTREQAAGRVRRAGAEPPGERGEPLHPHRPRHVHAVLLDAEDGRQR